MVLTDLFSSLFKKKKKEGGADNSTASFSDWKNTASDQSKRDTVKQAEKQEQAKKDETKKAEAQKNQGDSKLKKSLTDMISDIGKVQTMNTESKLEPSKKAGEEVSKAINIFGDEQEKKREKLKYEMVKNGGNRQAAQNAVDRSNTYADTDSKLYNKVHNFGVGAQELGSNLGTGFTNDTMSSLVSGIANAAQVVHNIPYDAMRRQYDRNNEMLRRDHFTEIPEGMDEATYRQSIETQNKRLLEQMNAYNTNGIVGSDAVNTALNGFQRGTREVHEYYRDSDSPIMNNLYNTFENAGSNIGNMAVGAALGTLGIPASVGGKIALGVSAFGNEADNQLQNTGNQDAAVSAAQEAGQAAVTQANAQIQATYDRVLKATGDKNAALQAAQEVYTQVWNNAAQDAYSTALRQTGDPLYAAAKGGASALNEELQEAISPAGTAFSNVASNITDLLMEGVQEAAGTYMEQLEDPLAYAILGGDEYSGKAKESAKEAVNNIAGKNAWNTAKEAGKAFGGGVESSLLLGGLTNPTGLVEGISEDAKMAYSVRRNKVGLDETNKTISAIESATAGRKLTDAEQSALNDEYAKKADFERFFANPYFTQSSSKSMRRTGQQAAEELTNISAKLSNAKISDTTLNNIKSLSKATKTAVEFKDDLYDADGNEVNGLYKDGIIQINSNLSTDQAVNTVLAHEMAHSLETSENYNAYKNALNDLIENGDVDIGYDSISDLQNAIRQTYGDQIKEDQLDNETVAFITEKLIGNETALTELAQNNSSLAGRLSSWIDNTAEQISGDRAQSQLAKVRKLLNRAINTTSRKDVGEQYKERTPEEKAKIANEKLNLLRRSGPYMFSNDKQNAEKVVIDLANQFAEGKLTEEQVSDELNKQLGDPTLADSDESTNKTQAVKEKTGKKKSKAKSAKETKAGEAKVEESAADAATRMNAEKQEQAAKNAKKSHEFFQKVKEAEAAKAKAQQEGQEKQEKVETEKQRAKRLAKEERDKARAERQAAKDAEAKAKAEETAFKKNYSDLGNDKFSGVPLTLRNDFKWSAQKFIKTRTSAISSALPEGTSEGTKTAIFNNVKYKALTDYQQESFNALKNNTDVSEEAKNKAVDDVVKILKDNGVEKLNEVKGKSFDNLEDAVRNILFPPRGGARKAKTAKTAEQQEQEIFDQTMNQPKVEQQKVEKPKAKKAKTEKPKAPVVETKAEEVKAPVVEKVEQPKVETAEQQKQAIFDKTVNNIEKKNPYKVKVTPENRQAIIDKVEKYKADFVQRLVDLGAERDVSERLAQKIAETGKWKANSADVSIENDNDRATAWHQIEKANPYYKTEDIKKWFADAMKLIPSEYRNIGLYDNPTYWVNKRTKVDDTKPASAQAKLLTDAGISGELANETVNAILNKTGGKDGNKATWAKGTYNDLMAAVANKEGLNLKDDADKQKARDILGGLKRQVIDQLTKNGWKTTKAEPAKAETVQADTKTPTKATIPTTAKTEETVVSQMRDLFKSGMLNADGTFSNNEAKSEQYKRNVTDEVADDYANRLRDQIDRLKEQVGEKTAQSISEGVVKDAKAKANGEAKTPTQVQEEQAQEDLSQAIGDVPKDQIKVNQWQKRQGYTDSSDKTDIENAKAIRRQNNNENIASGKYVIRHIQEFNDKADQLIDTLLKGDETLKEKDVDDKVIGLANKYLSSNNTSDLAGEKAPAWKKLKNSFSYSDDAMMFAVGNKVKELVDEGEKSIVDQLRADGIDATFISIGAGEDGRMIDRAVLYELDENGNVKVNEKGEKIKVKGEEYDKVVQSLNDYHRAMFQINEKMAGLTNNAGTVLRLAVENAQNSPAACFDSMMDRLENIQKQIDKKNKGNVDIAGTIRAKYEQKWADADEAGRVKLMSEIATEAGEMMPTTTKEKMDSWRMMMMLVNPTTHIRNVLGNLMMQGAVSMKNLNYRVIQSAVEKNGNVQEHEFIPRNNSDKNLLANVNTSLEKYGTETMKRWQEGKFKASGELADELKKNFSSSNRFRFINSEAFRDRVVNELAYQMRDAKTQENSGVFENEQMDEMFNKAYNLASKKWLQRSDLRTGNRYGLKFEKGELSKTGDLLKKYYDEHLKEDTNIIDSKTGKGFDGKVYQAHSNNIFNNKALDAVSSANNKALSLEDTFVMKGRYVSSMKQILTAQGYKLTGFNKDGNPILTEYSTNKSISRERSSEIFNRISEMALQEAKESAYHDANKLADLLNDAANNNKIIGVFADSNLPFKKTPMNITRRMVEYSPLWFINAAKQYQNVQNGTATADQFINSMAKAMTGAEVVVLGMLLKHLGFLRGTGDDDDDSKVKKFENELGGKQDYSLVLPNGATYTLGWLAPVSGPLFVGVQIMSELEDMWHGDEFDAFEVIKSSIAPILDSSYLSGIQNSIDTANNYVNYGYQLTPNGKVREASFLEGLIIGTLQNYVGQYSPAVGGKFVKAATGKDLDTFSPNVVEKMYRTAASKEIFLYLLTNYVSQQKTGHDYLLPRVNSNGEEMESTGGNLGGRFAYQMLSPGSYKKDRRDNVDNELERLYKSTNENYILPSQLYRLGDQSLNGYDKYAYNKNVLSSEKKSISEFVNSASYQDYTDPERAQIIRQIRTGAYHDAEEKYRKENRFPMEGSFLTESDKARNAIMGVSNSTQGSTFKEWQYYAIKNMKNDVDEDGNQIYNTSAMNARMIYEAAGIWGNVQEAVVSGKIKAGQAGLTNTVATWDDSTFTANYTKYQNGEYGTGSESKTDLEKEADRRATLEENKELADRTESVGVDLGTLLDARAAKSTKDEYGDAITYSQDLNARTTLTEDEIAKYQQAVKDGTMTILQATQDTGINAKVLMASSADYETLAKALAEGTYDSKAATKTLKKYAKWQKIATEQKKKAEGKADSSSGSGSGSRSDSDDEAKATIKMLKNFVEAMADASASQAKTYKKQLQASLNTLAKSDQDIYDEVMSADDLTKKLDLYGIKIKSQA